MLKLFYFQPSPRLLPQKLSLKFDPFSWYKKKSLMILDWWNSLLYKNNFSSFFLLIVGSYFDVHRFFMSRNIFLGQLNRVVNFLLIILRHGREPSQNNFYHRPPVIFLVSKILLNRLFPSYKMNHILYKL